MTCEVYGKKKQLHNYSHVTVAKSVCVHISSWCHIEFVDRLVHTHHVLLQNILPVDVILNLYRVGCFR